MTSRRPLEAVRVLAPHAVALAVLLWPLVGVLYVPMVDLPGHLAITRVLDDYLHGSFRSSLQLNLDPVHKPAYVLLYALFAVLPKPLVGPVAAGAIVVLFHAAVVYGIASLAKRPASSPLVASLALLIGMFVYNSLFFWGLIPFLLAMPPALVAYVAYLRASGSVDGPGTNGDALVFVTAAVLAHVVHPLATIFLAIMVAGAALAALLSESMERATGRSQATAHALWAIAWPPVVWVAAVAALQYLTAPPDYGGTLGRSAAAVAAPFHGLEAARAFLAQTGIELGMVPTREPAATLVAYPVAVALFLIAALAALLVVSVTSRPLRHGTGPAQPAPDRAPSRRLAVVFVVSIFLYLFVRHDLLPMPHRNLWFPVRAPGFLVFFFGTLAAALVLRRLPPSGPSAIVSAVLVVAVLAIATERSVVLHAHFASFDEKVQAFFRGDMPDRYFRSQPFSYVDHIRAYNCFFDAACKDHSGLFFAIYPDATIYPVSRIAPP